MREFNFKIKIPRLASSMRATITNLAGAGLAVACAWTGFGMPAALGTGAVLVWVLGWLSESSTPREGSR